jgi:hypothetical protein
MPHYKDLSNSINLSLAACQNKLILAGDLPQDYNFAGVISRTLTIYPPIGEPNLTSYPTLSRHHYQVYL